MLDKKEGLVIPIGRGRADAGFRSRGTLAEGGRQMSRGSCFAILESHCRAPVSDELRGLMKAPESLFRVGNETEVSFSSDPDTGAGRIAASLLQGFPMPDEIPDFGIHLSSQGSSLFITLVDSSRKIVVQAEVSSQYSDSGSWLFFGRALRDAVSQAESMSVRKTPFSFVVNKEGVISVI